MVMVGEKHKHGAITIEIVEVIPYKNYAGKKEMMVGYKIKDGDYVSPVAHFWMGEGQDVSKKIREIVEYYKTIKSSLSR